jgi:hypothetical protein
LELAIILSYFSIDMPPAIGGFLFSSIVGPVRHWRDLCASGGILSASGRTCAPLAHRLTNNTQSKK